MNARLQRCTIRPWSLADADSLVRYANNRKIAMKLRDIFPHPYKSEDALNFLKYVMSETPTTTFAIGSNVEAIGCVGLRFGSDVNRLSAELGFWLGEPFWRKGIMSEVVRAFVPWAFEQFQLVRIEAEVFGSNEASAALLEKAGFEREGRLRSSILKDGVIEDSLVYRRIHDHSSNQAGERGLRPTQV